MAQTDLDFSLFVDGLDFGEGPRWHDGRLWYSDFYQHSIYAVTPEGEREKIVEVLTQPSGLGWTPDGTLLIVSMLDRKLLAYDGSALREHADLSAIATGNCNDMVVDAVGRAYVGNFGFDMMAGADPATATLAIVDPDGAVRAGPSDLGFPNGTVITDDGKTLIVGESMGQCYTAFTIASNGDLEDRRTWAATEGYAPDGCTMDADGGIWFADAMGNRIVRVMEGGEITHSQEMPSGTYACALGGENGTTLYVLTAVSAHPDKAAGSGAGSILAAEVSSPHAGRP